MIGNEFARSYNSFSGVDIKAVFGSQVVGELQGISYSITREKGPIYTMGQADPRSFSRGKRGIAGTMVFVMFDRHVLMGAFGMYQNAEDLQLKFMSDVDDVRPVPDSSGMIGGTVSELTLGTGSTATIGSTVQNQESALTSIGSDQEVSPAWFSDQLIPFDVTLAAANEYGALAVMRIYGIEIMNEGYGVSIDDMMSEIQNTYLARTIAPWRSIQDPGIPSVQSNGG